MGEKLKYKINSPLIKRLNDEKCSDLCGAWFLLVKFLDTIQNTAIHVFQ